MTTVFPLVDFICDMAARPGATDITLCSDGRVALRQNARIAVRVVDPLRELWSATVASCFPERPADARRAYTTVIRTSPGGRLRATLSADSAGESISVRVLPNRIQDPSELLLPETAEAFFLGLKGGLFLVSGPTGSGKSTSVAALLRRRSQTSGGKIICLEDPVESEHKGTETCVIVQREVGRSMISFADGLREAMLMDPDLICVQELRDRQAAETALSAALSGHLVVATIHAFGAVSAVQRMLALLGCSQEDVTLRESLALCLEGVMAQRLVPGYERLLPVFELMLMREGERRLPAMERLLRQGNWAGLGQEIEAGSRLGMMTWEESRRQRVEAGLLPGGQV